ncbi:unnamed protein product [Rotaria sp. Silwood1]|nr:unnamed protein product [Rotaria sp. Silwood1]CAF3424168.1 unnamed protein product [Rotaria sp. Silwood1]CAF3426758.1 unnamed protein product [Rotaria sp. Silwood1]CAF3437062.1 unnamed protein product [Rotaria sp. Silwood1]CAF4684713.1 unnamed protein product [Rotaria sp. Silwood1]
MQENNSQSVYTLNNKHNNNNESLINKFNDTSIRAEINQFIQQVNYWLMIVELCMVLFGVLGNSLALIVINRRSLRHTSSSVFITYLAIFDSLVLIVHFTCLITLHTIKSFIVHCFFTYLTDFITFTSVWIMVIMTIERCIAVHSPFLAKRFCTRKHARHAMYMLICFAFAFFSLTFPLVYTIDKRHEKCGVRKQYQTLLRIIKPTMFYFIPDLILLFNLFIIYQLFMAKRQRTQTLMNPENATHQIYAISFNRQQQQLTIMLVTVSLSFYLFTTPAIIDYILQRKPPNYRDAKRLKMRFLRSNLTVVWLQMSSATNFLFYYLCGSKFRAACLQTLTEISDYIQVKFGCNDQRSRSSSNPQTTSTLAMEMRPEMHYDHRHKVRSNSILQTYQYSNSSKRTSNDTITSSHLNSRRTSRCV